MNWKYTEKNEYPKENGEYLVSVIAEKWLVDCGDCPERYTAYAYWDSEEHEWSNGEGYEYDVYAWTEVIGPAETLHKKDWRDFFVGEKSTCNVLLNYCEKHKLKIGNVNVLDNEFCSAYAEIEIFCTRPEEDKIDNLINVWENN